METLISLLPLAVWFLLWGLGGWFVTRASFYITRTEQIPLALVIGFSLQTLFANMISIILGPVLDPTVSFLLAAGLVLAMGIILSFGTDWRDLFRIPFLPGQWLVLLITFWVTLLIQRGLAFFDDFAHLPTVSLMAAGDIPPHFALNPTVNYAYHYFLLLSGAQIARLGSMPVWTALDIARAIAFAASAVLVGTWVQRLTRSQVAGALGFMMTVFGSGTRWLLLFAPKNLVEQLSPAIAMIGSGKASGVDFATAMGGSWAIEGIGQAPIPFAFTNGIFPPGVLSASGPNSLISTGIMVFFLQTFNHWRSWRGAVVSILMTASLALLTEFGIILNLAAWGAVVLLYVFQRRTWKLPASMAQWLLVITLGNILGTVQGGALTDILLGSVRDLQGEAVASYQTVGFVLSLKPVIVSSHLGVLDLTRWQQLLIALIEIGPVLLVMPLMAIWGIKAYRWGRWYEAVLILSSFIALATVFIQFSGSTGVRNTSRLYSFVGLCSLYSVPLVWLWGVHRPQVVKLAVSALAVMVMFGGVVLFGLTLTATQRPVYSYFLSALDDRMYTLYWNQLESGSLVFDPDPSRATTVFGRPTNAAYTWYSFKPEWTDLRSHPDPFQLRQAGYRYAYLDNRYLAEISSFYQERLSNPCVELIDEFSDSEENFRRLLDLDACR